MLFGQVPKWKVSLSLCWHCFNICTTPVNSPNFVVWVVLKPAAFLQREKKSISNSKENSRSKSFVHPRKGGSLVRWAGTSRTSSTGRTSRRATSSWWTTWTTSTPNGESLGRLSSTCLARCRYKGKLWKWRERKIFISGPVWWSSDWWLRQAVVVYFHLRLVQPRTAHGGLQVLRGLWHPGLPKPGGVHGVHLLPAPTGHTIR